MDTLGFISRYEAILRERKIPKMQFYKDCGISDAAVSQWRKEKTKPSMTTVSTIAKILNVSAEYLLTGIEQKENPTKTVLGEAIPGYDSLSEENKLKAQEYIALLLNSQQT